MLVNQSVADLIASVRAAGGTIRRDGDTIELAAPTPLAPELVARIRAAKPALLSVLDDAPDWHRRHDEALVYWSALHGPEEAALLTWGELQNRWHRLHGQRFPGWQCAGCGDPIGGVAALDMADGNRVHLDGLDCLIRYGERWRGDAVTGSRALGIYPPPGFNVL